MFRALGEDCTYLEGTDYNGWLSCGLSVFFFGYNQHFEGTGSFDFSAGEGSLSTAFFFPADTHLCCFIHGLEAASFSQDFVDSSTFSLGQTKILLVTIAEF